MLKKFLLILCLIYSSVIFGDNVLLLDGDGDYISFSQPIINTNTFTIEGRALLHDSGGGFYNESPLFCQNSGTNDLQGSLINMILENPDGVIKFSLASADSPGVSYELPRAPYGQWYHYACVVDPDSIKLYVNGVLESRTVNTQPGAFNQNINHIEIGRHRVNETDYGYLNGMINEVRIWKTALSDTLIRQHMHGTINLSSVDPNLTAYWRFDDIVYDTTNDNRDKRVKDLTGNGNDGILHGDAALVQYRSDQYDGIVRIGSATASNRQGMYAPLHIDIPIEINNITVSIECDTTLAKLVTVVPNPEMIFLNSSYIPYEQSGNNWIISVTSPYNFGSLGNLLWLKWEATNPTSEVIPLTLKTAEYSGQRESLVLVSGEIYVEPDITNIVSDEKSPTQFKILQNYPNPFNPFTIIEYQLENQSEIDLSIYNVNGERVATLLHDFRLAGTHAVQWNAQNQAGNKVASGIYFVRLQTNDFVKIHKIVLQK